MEFGTFIRALGSFVESNKASLTLAISESSTVQGVFQDRIKSSLKDNFLHLSGVSGILRGVVGVAWHLSGELTGSYLKLNYIRSSPKEAIFEIIKDPELVIFFEKNTDIVENVIRESCLTNVSDEGTKKQIIEESKKASAELVTLISAVQRLVSEKHISSLDKLVECISANNDKEMESLLEPIQKSLRIFTDLVNLNPGIIFDNVMIRAVTPDSEIHRLKYERHAVLALRNSVDRAKRDSEKKLGKHFVEYREHKDPGVGHFLDGYCDHFIRKKSLSGVHLEVIDSSHLEIDDFDFKFSELKRVNFSHTKIKNCDFGCVLFAGTIDFSDAEIDIETFKTMLPSLRQAKAAGQSVDLNNCKIIGNTKSLDLSGIDITGLNLEFLKVEELKILKESKFTLPRSRHEIITSDLVGSADEISFRRRLARFTRMHREEIARSLLNGRSNTVSLSEFFRDYENALYDSLVKSCKSRDLEIKTLLDILDESTAVSSEIVKHWDDVKYAVSYKKISSGYIWNTERPLVSEKVLEEAFGKFFHVVKHEAKFRFRDRIRNKPLSNDEGKTFTDHPERVEAFDKVLDYISRDDYLHDFVSHTPKDKPTWIGKKVRMYVVAVVPSFAKPYFYESTQVGKMIESRSILQLMGMTVRFLMNYRSISRLWSNVVPVLDDLNYYYVWRKDHDLKKSRADVLYHVIQNKMIRKNLAQYNKDGTVKKDDS